MRAVFLSHTYVSPHARGKLRALAGLGCAVAVAVPDRWVDPRGSGAVDTEWNDDGGVRVVPIAISGDAAEPGELRWDARAVRRLLKDFRPDVLQVEEEPSSRAAALAIAEARRLGIPSVVFTWESLPRAATISQRLRRRRVLRHVAGIVSGNPLADRLIAGTGVALPRAIIPQVGVTPPPASAPATGSLALGFIGRLVPEKGLDLLLRAAVKLRGDWTLDVVGTGPSQVELEALAERLGISARVTWHGALPKTELAAVWDALGCLVVPSRATRGWVETYGGGAVEAMARGIPVVASDTGALRDTIGEGGLLVPEDHADALAAALQGLVDDPTERAGVGAAGRRRVMGRFTSEAIARRQLEFWRGLKVSGSRAND